MARIELAARLEGVDPFGEDVLLDEGIMEALPAGCRVLSTSRAGQSLWVETMRIEVKLPDGSIRNFFKKGAAGAAGLLMVKGAFESEKTLYEFIPEYVARPVAFGTYKSVPDAHFYIADFVEMDEVHPSVKKWAICVSQLHARTMGKSPGGKFGFHATTHLANIPIIKNWSSTWEECFSNVMRSLCEIEEQRRPPQDDWTDAKRLLFDVVIPRYLRPLESEGRSIQPCLLHCDLWPGNTMPRSHSPEKLCIFDSAALWGHNEMDLGVTRRDIWNLENHGESYRELMGVSEPQKDYDDRLELYAVKGLVLRSAMYFEEPNRRELAVKAIRALADKAMTQTQQQSSN